MRNCDICGKPVVLVPSAAERARKYGGTPAHYEALFPSHAECLVAKRDREARELMARLDAEARARKVVIKCS